MTQTTRIRRLDRLARRAEPEVRFRVIFDWGDGDQLSPLDGRGAKEGGDTAAGDPRIDWDRAAPP